MKARTETQGRRRRYGMIAILIAAGIGLFIWGTLYIHTPVFYVNGDKYAKKGEDKDRILYQTRGAGPDIAVSGPPEAKSVHVGNYIYKVSVESQSHSYRGSIYRIDYPDRSRIVGTYDNGSGFFYRQTHNGYEPIYPDVGPYVGGKPLEPVKWDELKAGVIMKMAYESNQSTQGKALYYYIGYVVILIGMIGFCCPEAAFYLSYPIWVENPKPSDDYIVAARFGAVLAVICGFFLILRALGISS